MQTKVIGMVFLMLAIVSRGFVQGDELPPSAAGEMWGQGYCGNHRVVPGDNLFARERDIAEGDEHEDELGKVSGDDPLFQELSSSPGIDITAITATPGPCNLTPLICLWKGYAADVRCTYGCISLYGTGEITSNQRSECDPLIGCILFQNCLALCISIIPHEPRPVIR